MSHLTDFVLLLLHLFPSIWYVEFHSALLAGWERAKPCQLKPTFTKNFECTWIVDSLLTDFILFLTSFIRFIFRSHFTDALPRCIARRCECLWYSCIRINAIAYERKQRIASYHQCIYSLYQPMCVSRCVNDSDTSPFSYIIQIVYKLNRYFLNVLYIYFIAIVCLYSVSLTRYFVVIWHKYSHSRLLHSMRLRIA